MHVWPLLRVVLALGLLCAVGTARASFLPPEMLDKAADIVAIVVLCFVPIAVIVVFWLVHVLPEKIAEKRHHPQKEAITTLCLLSLVFGGMLWPLAWIWAYTRPALHRAAYGTDLHEDYFVEMGEKLREGTLMRDEARHLREELESMEARGALPPALRPLKDELDRLRALALAADEGAAPQAPPSQAPVLAAKSGGGA